MIRIYAGVDFPVPVQSTFCAYTHSGTTDKVVARRIINNELWLEAYKQQLKEKLFNKEFPKNMLSYRQRLFNLGVPLDHAYDDLAPTGTDGQPLVTENSNGSDEVFWNR